MNQKQKDRSGMGVRMTERMFPCPPLNGFLESNIILQNEPSILVGHVVEPKEGDSVFISTILFLFLVDVSFLF